MTREDWKGRLKDWQRFEEWQRKEESHLSPQDALRIVGEWVDFFLARYPASPPPVPGEGVKKLHEALSHIRLPE